MNLREIAKPALTKPTSDRLLLFFDFAGTLVFAVEGAMAAENGDLDLLGAMVLAFATALGGGIIRDLLIGAVPPNSIRDWRYGAIALAAAGIEILLPNPAHGIPGSVLMILDAAGLGLFAVAGAEKALAYGINPLLAILMGGITGVGGGTIRDVLLAQVPNVLRADVYASAALAGAAVVVIGLKLKLPRAAVAIAGGVICFLLRVVSVWLHWNLPKAAH
ncbi:MAG TPA: TRIC cation channel family protein [Silvibacterium sp.]|nr:TRIC cation channel family protein [Silvibacterium sp.]